MDERRNENIERNVGGTSGIGETRVGTGGQSGIGERRGEIGREGIGQGWETFRGDLGADVKYPLQRSDLLSRHGERNIDRGGKQFRLRDLFQGLKRDRWNSEDEFRRDVEALPDYRNYYGGR